MRQTNIHWKTALALVFLLLATGVNARRLMEIDDIELRGTAQVVMYGAATCHIREINHSEEEYERLKVNEGKPLDHLVARYNIESQWPPCTNWSYNPESPTTSASWSSQSGHVQRTAKPFSVAPGETLTEELVFIVFHEDTPRFANWSVDYNFVEGTHATPAGQPAETPAEPPAEQPTQTRTTAPPPAQAQATTPPPQASDMPAGISAGETCTGKPEKSSCWLELQNQPGCYIWNASLGVNESATWSGGCTNGLAEGTGEIIWAWESDREQQKATDTGQFKGGKRHGQWIIREADGDVKEGPYVDGKRHGHWVIRTAYDFVHEPFYVYGKRYDLSNWSKDLKSTQEVLAAGIDVNKIYSAGRTALTSAVLESAPPEVIAALLEAGVDVNPVDLALAIRRGFECDDNNYVATVKMLLEAGANARYRSSDGESMLQLIDARGCSLSAATLVISMLINEGADINAGDKDGNTPLHVTALQSLVGATTALLDAGADIKRKNDYGQTALHNAVSGSRGYDRDYLESFYNDFFDNPEEMEEYIQDDVSDAVSTVKVLLSSGADPRARDANGRTPLDYIGDNSLLKNTEIYWELRDAQRSHE